MLKKDMETYNFYKLENKLSKDKDGFLNDLDALLESNGLDYTLKILKSSGLPVNIFGSSKHTKFYDKILTHITSKIEHKELQKIQYFKEEVSLFEHLFKILHEQRDTFFKEHEGIKKEHKVISFLMALEIFLSFLTNKNLKNQENLIPIPKEINLDFNKKRAIFDTTVESTGMILNYFMYQSYDFKGCKNNISPKILKASSNHIIFSRFHSYLIDILEYWKYSDVEMKANENGKILFNILNKDLELNNLVSNERFNNMRLGWSIGAMGDVEHSSSNGDSGSIDSRLNEKLSDLNYLAARQYFGSPLLDIKIKGIELKSWIYAYELLVEESKKFVNRKQNLHVYNVDKICLSKPIDKWEKFFLQKGFTVEESKIIITMFTFDGKCSDLIDSPFIKIDNNLVIIPTLTSRADVARALASNFLNRNINLDFKGPGFEERVKSQLNINGIKNSSLFKRTGGTEYECDVAFILNEELFLIECKAHVQPYTTRQHVNHLYKLYNETSQINRIADFYESNSQIVNQQLNLNKDFKPRKVHRILLTTSMVGMPLFINNVYIVDESAFTMFINRTPPSTHKFDNKYYSESPSQKFEIFDGELSANKMIKFLKSPPQIQITTDLFQTKELSFDLFNIRRNIQVIETIQTSPRLPDSVLSHIKKYF